MKLDEFFGNYKKTSSAAKFKSTSDILYHIYEYIDNRTYRPVEVNLIIIRDNVSDFNNIITLGLGISKVYGMDISLLTDGNYYIIHLLNDKYLLLDNRDNVIFNIKERKVKSNLIGADVFNTAKQFNEVIKLYKESNNDETK